MSEREQNLKILPDTYLRIFKALPTPTYLWKKVGDDLVLIDYNDYADKLVNGKMMKFLRIKASYLYKDKFEVLEDLNRCFKDKVEFTKEMKYKTKKMERDIRVSYKFIQPDFILVHTDDITLQREAENAIKASEEKFRTITDQALMGIGILQDNDLKYCNQRLADITGYSIEELKKKRAGALFDLIHPEDKQKVVEQILKKQKGEKEVKNRYNYRTIKKTGEVIWIELFSKTINYGGKPAILATFLDITDKKYAEEKLKESEEKFRMISQESLVGIGILQDGKVKYVNQQIAEAVEYSIEEMMKWSASEFIKGIYPGDQIMELDLINQILTNPKANKFQFEARGVKKSGGIFWIDLLLKKIEYENRPALLGILIDITDRKKAEEMLKESEEKYRLFLENFQGIAYQADILLSKPIFFQGMIEDITGYTAEDFMKEKISWLQLVHPDDLKLIQSEGHKLKSVPDYVANNIYRIQHKNGEIRWVNDINRRVPIFEKSNTIQGAVYDITKRKRAEEALKDAYNRTNFYKDIFTHDMNNIFQTILTTSELLSIYLDNSENFEKIKELSKFFKEQVNRGTRLIFNVRRLSQLDESEISIKLLEVCEILKNSISFVKEYFQEKNININVNSPRKNYFVLANDLLQEVFDNILINAVRHNINLNIEIEVGISQIRDKNLNFIRMEFKDNGIGIKDERKKLIFERGYKKEKSSIGMGLGLSLVKEIIDRFNGQIWIEDKVLGDYAKGANFVILIPEVVSKS